MSVETLPHAGITDRLGLLSAFQALVNRFRLPRQPRKADTKHKNYDLEMIVDDNQMSKKRVNLYEPIWIHTENESQPVQIVVNRIEKNLIHGYVSAPKYKPSELATSGAVSTLTPAAPPAA